jgi:predicted GIY-YIG superfamily endonuclease
MRRPLQLIYFEAQASLIKARRREKQIKGWSYAKKLNLINQSLKNTKLSQFPP